MLSIDLYIDLDNNSGDNLWIVYSCFYNLYSCLYNFPDPNMNGWSHCKFTYFSVLPLPVHVR